MRVNLELENNMVWYVRAAGAHSEPVGEKYLGWFRWQGQIGTELGAGRKKDGASLGDGRGWELSYRRRDMRVENRRGNGS